MKVISIISAILFCLAAKAQPLKIVHQQLIGTYFENLVGISIDEKKEVVLILDSLNTFSLTGIYGIKEKSHKGKWTIEKDSLVLECVYSGNRYEMIPNKTPILKKYPIVLDALQKPMLQGWNKERALTMPDLAGNYQTHYHLHIGATAGILQLTCEFAPMNPPLHPLQDMTLRYYGFFAYKPYSTRGNSKTIIGSWFLIPQDSSLKTAITFTPNDTHLKPFTMEIAYREAFLFKEQPAAGGRCNAAFDHFFSHAFAPQ
jgi:hypothetical protein